MRRKLYVIEFLPVQLFRGKKMPTVISEEDYAATKVMIEGGALVPIETSRLPRSGWGMVYCGDGDVTPRAIGEHRRMLRKANGEDVCMHLIPWDGGPAGIPPHSPFHRLEYGGDGIRARTFVFGRIAGALRLKAGRLRHIGFVPHCTCTMCRLNNVSIWQNFRLTIEGKDAARAEFNGQITHYKVFPRLDFSGWPEASDRQNPFRNYLLVRPIFERMWDRQTSAIPG